MCPVPAVVGAVVGVEHIIAGILQVLGGAFRFFHAAALFGSGVAGNQAFGKALQLGFNAVAQRNGEVIAAGFLDGLYHFSGKAVAIFKAAAVFVGTLVIEFDGKLIQQIAFVYSVNFHTVNTGGLAQFGGLGKGFNNLMDLFLGHFGNDDIGGPAGRLCAGGSQLVAGIQNGLENSTGQLVLVQGAHQFGDGPAAAHAGGQLHKQLGSGLVDLVHEFLQVVEHLFILPQPLAPEGIAQGGDAGNDQTDVVIGTLDKKLSCLFVELAAGQFKPAEQRCAAHGAHDDAVFDFNIAYFPRGKQCLVLGIHRKSLLIFKLQKNRNSS